MFVFLLSQVFPVACMTLWTGWQIKKINREEEGVEYKHRRRDRHDRGQREESGELHSDRHSASQFWFNLFAGAISSQLFNLLPFRDWQYFKQKTAEMKIGFCAFLTISVTLRWVTCSDSELLHSSFSKVKLGIGWGTKYVIHTESHQGEQEPCDT